MSSLIELAVYCSFITLTDCSQNPSKTEKLLMRSRKTPMREFRTRAWVGMSEAPTSLSLDVKTVRSCCSTSHSLL